jgi:hypothetical protein
MSNQTSDKTEKGEPLPRSIIENMIAAGQIYWRKPLPLIPRKWAWAFVLSIPVAVVVAVVLYPS